MLKVGIATPVPMGSPPHPSRQTRARLPETSLPGISSVTPKRPHEGPHSLESPAKKQSKWTAAENAVIIELRAGGMKWEDISKKLPGRSAISCRLHYQNFLERRPEWDEEKKNKLARLYERFKDNMWKDVARELQMPWRAVEAMHWQIGAQEMADRAGVAVFSIHPPAVPQGPPSFKSEPSVGPRTSQLAPPAQAQYRQSSSNSPLEQPPAASAASYPTPIQPAYHGVPPPGAQQPHSIAPPQHQQQPYGPSPLTDGLVRQNTHLAPKAPASATPRAISPHPPEVRPHLLSRHLSQPDLSSARDREFHRSILSSERHDPLRRLSPTHRALTVSGTGTRDHIPPYTGPRLPPIPPPGSRLPHPGDDESRPRLPPLRMPSGDLPLHAHFTNHNENGSPEEHRRRESEGYWRPPDARASHRLSPPPPPPSQLPPSTTGAGQR